MGRYPLEAYRPSTPGHAAYRDAIRSEPQAEDTHSSSRSAACPESLISSHFVMCVRGLPSFVVSTDAFCESRRAIMFSSIGAVCRFAPDQNVAHAKAARILLLLTETIRIAPGFDLLLPQEIDTGFVTQGASL